MEGHDRSNGHEVKWALRRRDLRTSYCYIHIHETVFVFSTHMVAHVLAGHAIGALDHKNTKDG